MCRLGEEDFHRTLCFQQCRACGDANPDTPEGAPVSPCCLPTSDLPANSHQKIISLFQSQYVFSERKNISLLLQFVNGSEKPENKSVQQVKLSLQQQRIYFVSALARHLFSSF